MPTRRYKLIACEILFRELSFCAAKSCNLIDITFLPKALHDSGEKKMSTRLQESIDQVDSLKYEAILLGYGLCNNGIRGLHADLPMVVARAHDCITLLLGSKERYAKYAKEHPGTYWYSPGWNRHHIAPGQQRYEVLRAQYVEKYGEEDADFLMEEEQRWFSTYDRATFVDLKVLPTEVDEAYTKGCADWLGWNYDRQEGDPGLLKRLLSGVWPEDEFLVLKPGQSLRMAVDQQVIEAAHAS